MRIPLVAYAEKDGLRVVRDQRKEFVPFPVQPTCFVRREFSNLDPRDNPMWEEWTDIWTKEPVQLYKKTFDDPFECYRYYTANRASQCLFAMQYLEYLYAYKHDYFYNFPHTSEPTVLTFDIEVWNDGNGRFPKAETHPIIAIAYKINDEPTKVIDCYDDTLKDKNILEEFMKVYTEADVDIVVGYNCLGVTGEGFDIPYIVTRLQLNGMDVTKLSRWDQVPYKFNKKEKKNEYHFYGRCIFDIFNAVFKDQSLANCKNKKLETVAEWYHYKAYKFQDVYTKDSSGVIRTEELRKHVASDVDATYHLFKVYFPVQLALAEMMCIPLENLINSYSSFIPKIFQTRNLFKIKHIGFQSNAVRYSDTRFQAALSNVGRTGIVSDVWGIDFASFYPSLMRTLNLCYSKDTEILTENGWKLFSDTSLKERICTLNPDTHVIEYVYPKSIQSFDYTGKLYSLETKQLDLQVTPNHNMFVSKPRKKEFKLIPAENIYNRQSQYKRDGIWDAPYVDVFILPASGWKQRNKWGGINVVTLPSRTFKMDDWLEFLGYFVSEGCTSYRNGEYHIILSQLPSNQTKMKACLDRLGLKYYSYPHSKNIVVLDKQLYDYLRVLGKSHDKYIPREFLNLPKKQLSILFDALMFGDGSYDGIYPSYTTTSKRLADDVQEIVLKIGKAATIGARKRGIGRHICYRVYISIKCFIPTVNAHGIKNDSWMDYSDKVWCCTMPKNHVIYVRRNNKPCWSGNSPERIKFIGFLPFTGQYKFRSDEKILWARIPDENFQKDVMLRIDIANDGFLRVEMDRFFDLRAQLKKKMAECPENEKMRYKSQENAIKVLMNSCFTKDTDVLTSTGIKTIDKCKVGDKLLSINPKTRHVSWQPVIAVQKASTDRIYHYSNNYVDWKITGDHKLLVSKDGKLCFMTAESLFSRGESFFTASGNKIYPVADCKVYNFPKKISVYCVTVENNHTIYAGRNEKMDWIGQCFGIQGLSTSVVGDMPTGLAIASFGRWILGNVLEHYKEHAVQWDSVTGDTLIWTRKGVSTHCRLLRIDELIPGELDGKVARYRDFDTDLNVLTRNGWRQIQYVKKHLVTKDIYLVETNHGRVKVTEDHSLFTPDRKEITPLELKVGDEIEAINFRHWNKLRHERRTVTNIEKLPPGETYVYDISTEDGTFVCASGGIVLHNTDGVSVDIQPDMEEINKWVADLLWKECKVKSRVRFDLKGHYAGYFYKAKNYILRDDEGKYIRHGVSMKSSKNPKFYDVTIDIISRAIMENKPMEEIVELSKSLLKLNQFSLDDFVQRTRISKLHPNTKLKVEEDMIYSNENALQPYLLKRSKELYGRDLGIGDYIEYYKGPEGYVLKDEISAISELDMVYYREKVVTALKIFGMDPVTMEAKGVALDSWVDEEGKPIPIKVKRVRKKKEVVIEEEEETV